MSASVAPKGWFRDKKIKRMVHVINAIKVQGRSIFVNTEFFIFGLTAKMPLFNFFFREYMNSTRLNTPRKFISISSKLPLEVPPRRSQRKKKQEVSPMVSPKAMVTFKRMVEAWFSPSCVSIKQEVSR